MVLQEDSELLRRAMAAHFRAGNHDQPSNSSDVQDVGGRLYVVLRNVSGILAVYRVRTDGVLKGLKRWPAVIV